MNNLFLSNPAKFLAVAVVVLAVVSVPLLGFAQLFDPNNPTDIPGEVVLNNVDDVFGILTGIFNILFIALIILAGIFLILAAFAYLTAGGEPEKIQKANHRVVYAAVAVGLGLVARSVPFIVRSVVA